MFDKIREFDYQGDLRKLTRTYICLKKLESMGHEVDQLVLSDLEKRLHDNGSDLPMYMLNGVMQDKCCFDDTCVIWDWIKSQELVLDFAEKLNNSRRDLYVVHGNDLYEYPALGFRFGFSKGVGPDEICIFWEKLIPYTIVMVFRDVDPGSVRFETMGFNIKDREVIQIRDDSSSTDLVNMEEVYQFFEDLGYTVEVLPRAYEVRSS